MDNKDVKQYCKPLFTTKNNQHCRITSPQTTILFDPQYYISPDSQFNNNS